MLRFGFVVAAFVAGCNSILGLGDFTDQQESAPSASSQTGVAAMSASTGAGEAGGSFGGNGGSSFEGGSGGTVVAKRVFVSSMSLTPSDIGSVSQANSLCQGYAVASNLGGTWHAWLSGNDIKASENVTGEGPWVRLDMKPVFATRADLLSMSSAPVSPIVLTENSVELSGTVGVWTGTEKGGGAGLYCQSGNDDWVETDMTFGTFGTADLPAEWTSAGGTECDSSRRIYCFEI